MKVRRHNRRVKRITCCSPANVGVKRECTDVACQTKITTSATSYCNSASLRELYLYAYVLRTLFHTANQFQYYYRFVITTNWYSNWPR